MCRSRITVHCLYLLLVLILFSQQWHCQTVTCGSNYPRPNFDKSYCVEGNDSGPCEMVDTEMIVKDIGKVDVTFTVTSTNCSLYRLQLKINKSVAEINCVNTSKKYINENFGEMKLSMKNKFTSSCEGISCGTGEKVNVTFEDISTGCYKLHYCTATSESSQTCDQLVKYINTSIKVSRNVRFPKPNITPSPNEERKEVGITISNYTRFSQIQLTVRPDNDTENCTSDNHNPITIWVARDVNGRLMCRKRNQTNCLAKHMMGQDENCNNKIECHEKINSIYCMFKNIVPGKYCVHLFAYDPRCNMKECKWNQSFEMKKKIEQSVSVKESPMSIVYLALIVAFGFFLLVTFIIVVLICRRRWNNPTRVLIGVDYNIWLQSPEILLLYPRDCKAFMDMMATCKKIMEERTGCKIYDCFDSHQSEDLSLNKVEWMRKHVLRHNMKVIVIQTACAVLHQKALIQNNRLTYSEPTWLDDLFLFGLKLLTDNLDRNNYQRVFVVCIEDFSGERDSLHLTPYIRYVIPRDLEQLVTDLNGHNLERNAINTGENEIVQRFEHDLKNLINYRMQNPEYLQQLLNIA